MLFLLKRTWPAGLISLLILCLIGLALRSLLGGGTELGFSPRAILLGLSVFTLVIVSDVTLHVLFCLLFGERYRRRHRELAAVFQGQTYAALLVGALMAGLGEELVFRGLGTNPLYLIGGGVVFGLLHHIRRSLWPFTIWAIWQGLLFAGAMYYTELLCVTMTAHFLHDLTGFLIFRYLNRPPPPPGYFSVSSFAPH
jgi:membrane protease YdiL (CAAX protease family)